jgi:hypothetical protein
LGIGAIVLRLFRLEAHRLPFWTDASAQGVAKESIAGRLVVGGAVIVLAATPAHWSRLAQVRRAATFTDAPLGVVAVHHEPIGAVVAGTALAAFIGHKAAARPVDRLIRWACTGSIGLAFPPTGAGRSTGGAAPANPWRAASAARLRRVAYAAGFPTAVGSTVPTAAFRRARDDGGR